MKRDIKIESVKMYDPYRDVDCELQLSSNVPYEIVAVIDGVRLSIKNALFIAGSNGYYSFSELFSLADSFDFLSEEGKEEFMVKFMNKYIGPLLWRKKFKEETKALTKKEKENLEFCISCISEVRPNYLKEVIGESWL